MDFDLTDEQRTLQQTIRDFAERHLTPGARERDRDGELSLDLWRRCADIGLTGLTVTPEYGGQGADALTAVIALEALGHGCRDNGLVFSLNAHLWSAAMPIERFGSDAQKERWLRPLVDGTSIGVQAMTEPDSGSDAFALRTSAEVHEGGFVLNGTKTYITNAPVADVFVVFASTDPDRGWAGITAFLVDRSLPGVDVGPPFDKLGLHTSPMGEIHFDDVVVDADAVLGRVGGGLLVFDHSMEWERGCVLASAVGSMQYQLERSAVYARTREQFGTHIGAFQAVSHRVVDMQVRVEAARLLLYRMAWRRAKGERVAEDAALVKLFVSESWVESSLDHLRIHGAYGYMSESGVEADVRDSLASRIYSGTSDIQRNILARGLRL